MKIIMIRMILILQFVHAHCRCHTVRSEAWITEHYLLKADWKKVLFKSKSEDTDRFSLLNEIRETSSDLMTICAEATERANRFGAWSVEYLRTGCLRTGVSGMDGFAIDRGEGTKAKMPYGH